MPGVLRHSSFVFAIIAILAFAAPIGHAQRPAGQPHDTAALLSSSAIDRSALNSSPQAGGLETDESTTEYPPQLLVELARLRDAALQSDYAYRQLRHLTNNIGPRPSGSPQAQHAVEYVAAELRRLGLEVRLVKAMVPHWVRGQETAELVEYSGQAPGTTQKIVLTALGNSTATPPDGLTAEVIVVESFDQLKALGRERIAGKIVLFNVAFDKQMAAQGNAGTAYGQAVLYRTKGAKAAAPLGAVASLIRSVGSAEYRLPHTGISDPAGIPAGAVTAEDADLIAQLASEGPVRMHLTLTPRKLPDVESYNVVADLKGSEHPEQVVIVSGHLDSWDLGTGAIDDGAGVVIAMATAELIQELHLRPKRTIRVIAWMDEERGGSGSDAYTKEFSAEFPNYVGAIEGDSGAGHPAGFHASVTRAALPLLEPVSEVLRVTGATLIRLADGPNVGADITAIAKTGVPSFGLLQDNRKYFHYHHTAADTLDKVVPHELAENAAAMAVLAYALADMPQTLPR
jgi:carboxypeptidase Q